LDKKELRRKVLAALLLNGEPTTLDGLDVFFRQKEGVICPLDDIWQAAEWLVENQRALLGSDVSGARTWQAVVTLYQ
jgi:hypothetical protein